MFAFAAVHRRVSSRQSRAIMRAIGGKSMSES
jgi:hypothetical protein